MEHVAIVGTGVAGLGCAWHLKDRARITLFEKNPIPGGHTNTVMVQEDGRGIPIDTGFIVFNKVTYPNLTRLFAELDVRIKPSEMSFSVQHPSTGLEYNGMGWNRIFARRRNLLNVRFLKVLLQIGKFFKLSTEALEDPACETLTMREFAVRSGLSKDFLEFYLVPMCSAVWSTDPGSVLDFPARTLVRFFHNHGFLGVTTHHPWFTVDGGARTYLEKILSRLDAVNVGTKVVGVTENSSDTELTLEDGRRMSFDRVVLAGHADQSLALLSPPDTEQLRLLAPFQYQANHATLHTDESVMPKCRRAWASWNYRVEGDRCATHYWMNALQGVSDRKNYFVSLNVKGTIPAEKVLYETNYEHPVFTLEAMQAQRELPTLNARSPGQRVFFCGSYFKYGFHEDAYSSGLTLAQSLNAILAA